MLAVHLICWGLPLVVTLLPLTTNTYGKMDDDSVWCFITNRSGSPSWGVLVWEIVTFYSWIWLLIASNVCLIFAALLQIHQIKDMEASVIWQLRKLCLYPIVAIFCWTASTLTDIYMRATR
jgi:hypothetical protein